MLKYRNKKETNPVVKNKHNKKKNTILLFECATKELAKCLLEKNEEQSKKIISLLKEFFSKDSLLSQEIAIYKEILNTSNQDKVFCEKMLEEAKKRYADLPQDVLSIDRMRFVKKLSSIRPKFLENFSEDFRNFATLYQVLNPAEGVPIKTKLLMESSVVEKMSSPEKKEEDKLLPKDDLVMKSFIRRFNESYGSLLPKQKELIKRYTFSIGNKTVEYKMFLNEEIGRIKTAIKSKKGKYNEKVEKQLDEVLSICEGYSTQNDLQEKEIVRLLEIQEIMEVLENE